jgi:hypothetical protein
MPGTLHALLLVGLLLPLTGCATAALNAALRAANPGPPWNGEVTIASEPEGARCTVHRGDRVLAEVAATPGTIRLERSNATLDIRCEADGHLTVTEAMRPYDDPAVFRMAPTGIIGLTATIISAANATTMRYPGEVTIRLPPATFASEAERERWFAERREAILASRAAEIARLEDRCRAAPDQPCDPTLAVLREQEQEDLRRLDGLRARAGIAAQVALDR